MKAKFILTAALCILLAGCSTGRSPVSVGLVFTSVSGSESISGNNLGSHSGTACAMSILGLVAVGDASITTAANNGKLNKVSHVDYETTGILGVYSKSCTIAYGEIAQDGK